MFMESIEEENLQESQTELETYQMQSGDQQFLPKATSCSEINQNSYSTRNESVESFQSGNESTQIFQHESLPACHSLYLEAKQSQLLRKYSIKSANKVKKKINSGFQNCLKRKVQTLNLSKSMERVCIQYNPLQDTAIQNYFFSVDVASKSPQKQDFTLSNNYSLSKSSSQLQKKSLFNQKAQQIKLNQNLRKETQSKKSLEQANYKEFNEQLLQQHQKKDQFIIIQSQLKQRQLVVKTVVIIILAVIGTYLGNFL